MKKGKLVKNLISLGIAIAAIFVIAFYTKPQLPAPENLTATILLAPSGKTEVLTTFSPRLSSDGTFPTNYSYILKTSKGETLQLVFDVASNELILAKFNGKKLKNPKSLFENFQVITRDGQIQMSTVTPSFISNMFRKSVSASANAVEVTGNNIRNIGAAAKATVNAGGAGGIDAIKKAE